MSAGKTGSDAEPVSVTEKRADGVTDMFPKIDLSDFEEINTCGGIPGLRQRLPSTKHPKRKTK